MPSARVHGDVHQYQRASCCAAMHPSGTQIVSGMGVIDEGPGCRCRVWRAKDPISVKWIPEQQLA